MLQNRYRSFFFNLDIEELEQPIDGHQLLKKIGCRNRNILVCVWLQIKKPAYFTIQLIFATIHRPHCTFWYYL